MWGWLWRAPGVPLLRFRGVQVVGHPTMVIPIVVYSSVLGSTRFLGRYPDLPGAAITAMTIVSVFMGILSVLLHEFGHTFRARREGLRADKITLWGLGGVSWNSGAHSPGAAFRVTAAGPMVSVVLAVLFGAFSWFAWRAGLPHAVLGVALLLAEVNAAMLAFNLLPMVPMDGGRIVHSALWRLRGLGFATRWACRIGIAVASTVIVLGAAAPFLGIFSSVAGTAGLAIMVNGGIMLWMTLSYRSATQLRPRQSRELLVGDLVEEAGPREAPGVTIARFLENAAGSTRYGTAASAVVEDGRTMGVISRGLAGLVPVDQREKTAIADVMLRTEDAVVLQRETSVAEAFRMLQGASRRGVVLDRGRVTAIILTSDLADVLLQVKDAARGVDGR